MGVKVSDIKIEFISRNKDGNWYVGYKTKVQRGIKGKSRSKVDELLIIGIPDKKFDKWCKEHNIWVQDEEGHRWG